MLAAVLALTIGITTFDLQMFPLTMLKCFHCSNVSFDKYLHSHYAEKYKQKEQRLKVVSYFRKPNSRYY